MTSPDSEDARIPATERNPRLRLLIPLIVAIGFLMEQLDATILTTAIPSIARSLAITPVRLNLAITSYVLTLAVFIPVSGWFADRFGSRRVFALALAMFTLSSALCGAATSFEMLVVTRICQGFGGAMMTPVGRLILLRSFPRAQLMTAMTYMAMPAILGPIIGPMLGGLLTTYASWRWIFYVNVPFGAAGILLALRYVEDQDGDPAKKFDFFGFALVGSGFALLQLGMDNVGRSSLSAVTIWGCLVAAAALLGSFFFYSRRVAEPAVDLGLFRLRPFATGTLAGGLCRVAMNGTPFLLPLMLQIGFGMSPVESGSLTFLGSVGAMFVRAVIGRLLRRCGFRLLLIGSAVVASAFLGGFSFMQPTTAHWAIGFYVFAFGLAQAVQFMTSNALSYSEVPDKKLSSATSLGGVIQQLTVSFGVSCAAMLLSLVDWNGHTLGPDDFYHAFQAMALLPLLAIPGFLPLRPDDGARVSGYKRKA